MHEIRIKRIYDLPTDDDGYRVLVDRLWPRGTSKEKAQLNEWAKEIAPSNDLRQWFHHEPEKFELFSMQYQQELENNPLAIEWKAACQSNLSTGNVTLLYATKDPECNHALVLKKWLEKD